MNCVLFEYLQLFVTIVVQGSLLVLSCSYTQAWQLSHNVFFLSEQYLQLAISIWNSQLSHAKHNVYTGNGFTAVN